MSERPLYHQQPRVLRVETEVVDSRPGQVLLASSPFYPGGGGQLADRGTVRWRYGETSVAGFEATEGGVWVLLDDPAAELAGTVEAVVDPDFRALMTELHTGTHVLNALVFRSFDGALVTGVQMNEDGTARMDFDLPQADNDRLRALEAPINEVLRSGLAVTDGYVPLAEARREYGLIRSKSVAPPPTPDGLIRVVEIAALDRQACGGTHLESTAACRPLRVLKVDNKGRHNRRVRIGLVG